jgi:hypothetical protein
VLEFLKDISVNLISDAIWAIGGALFYHFFLRKAINLPPIQEPKDKKNYFFNLPPLCPQL